MLAEFAFPQGIAITRPWLKTVRNLSVSMILALVADVFVPGAKVWIVGIGLFISVVQAAAQIQSVGVAFRSVFCSGVQTPVYASYGIGYDELSRMLIKCSVIQLPLVLPFFALCGALIGWLGGLSYPPSGIMGLKAGMLWFATRFIFILFAFSSGTNDGSKFRLSTLILFGTIATLGIGFVALGLAGLFVPHALMAWSLCLLAVADAYVLIRVYGWFYRRSRFDLMNFPRR